MHDNPVFQPNSGKMEDWEKTDVFQALNKVLQKEFCHLFQNEGLVFNAESMLDQVTLLSELQVKPEMYCNCKTNSINNEIRYIWVSIKDVKKWFHFRHKRVKHIPYIYLPDDFMYGCSSMLITYL